MRWPLAVVLVFAALLLGFGLSFFWCQRQVQTIEQQLGDTSARLSAEVDTLRGEVERLQGAITEAERRLQEEQAARRQLEESLRKARVWK